MSFPGRKRASLVLLLVLAAGLAVAGSAAAAGPQEMACCPAGMEAGCTWLGAGDCCPERPTAPAPTQAAAPAPDMCSAPLPPVLPGAVLALATRAIPSQAATRNLVLRL